MSLVRTIVLTRDFDACVRSMQLWEPMFPNTKFIASPVRRIQQLDMKSNEAHLADAVIFTSINAFKFSKNIQIGKAYCVGENTAKAAREKGFKVEKICATSKELILIMAKLDPMKFVHLSGRPYTVDFSRLPALSHHQFEMQIHYEVEHVSWSDSERARIEESNQCIFPVFSISSAKSLIRNMAKLQSQFCAVILPISPEVGALFEGIDNILVHTPPKVPNFTSFTEMLTELLGEMTK